LPGRRAAHDEGSR